jgi:RNA polymerase sigma-70 factor (ECF subfamily)
VLRSLILVTGNRDVAVEATCEAFARALERWPRVSVMESPAGWTYRVALNVARRTLRRARMEALLFQREPPPPPGARGPRRALGRCCSRGCCPAHACPRRVFVARFSDGYRVWYLAH